MIGAPPLRLRCAVSKPHAYAMRSIALMLVLGLALSLLACSGGDDSSDDTPDATATPSDRDVARAMVLTREDFPRTWSQASSPDSESPYTRCDTTEAGRTARVEGAQYRKEDVALSEVVMIFESAEGAQQVLASLTASAECYAEVINFGDGDTFDTRLLNASVTPVEVLDGTGAAVRLQFEFEVKTRASELTPPAAVEDPPSVAYIDFVAAAEGRSAFVIQAYGALAPMDPAELAVYFSLAQEKMRANQAPLN